MIYAGIDVNIISHEKALEAVEKTGMGAFGLWTWGMAYAQLQRTNGRLPRIAVLGAMGAKRNIMLAKALVDVGLWSENEDGSWQIGKYAKKNQTTEEIEAKLEARREANAERQRMYRLRNAGNAPVTRVTEKASRVTVTNVTGPELPPEPELPLPERERAPAHVTRDRVQRPSPGEDVVEPIWSLDAALPGGWGADADGVLMASDVRDRIDVPAQWRLYLADRLRPEQTKAISPQDWRGWILRSVQFARKDRERDRERDGAAKLRREGPPLPPPPTPEESRRFSDDLVARMKKRTGT